MSKIKTAEITGQHAFEVPGFHGLFRSIPEIDFYRLQGGGTFRKSMPL